jgi:hypothetical protein
LTNETEGEGGRAGEYFEVKKILVSFDKPCLMIRLKIPNAGIEYCIPDTWTESKLNDFYFITRL